MSTRDDPSPTVINYLYVIRNPGCRVENHRALQNTLDIISSYLITCHHMSAYVIICQHFSSDVIILFYIISSPYMIIIHHDTSSYTTRHHRTPLSCIIIHNHKSLYKWYDHTSIDHDEPWYHIFPLSLSVYIYVTPCVMCTHLYVYTTSMGHRSICNEISSYTHICVSMPTHVTTYNIRHIPPMTP